MSAKLTTDSMIQPHGLGEFEVAEPDVVRPQSHVDAKIVGSFGGALGGKCSWGAAADATSNGR